jgi:hypothetical protein
MTGYNGGKVSLSPSAAFLKTAASLSSAGDLFIASDSEARTTMLGPAMPAKLTVVPLWKSPRTTSADPGFRAPDV